jgi:hypothetical protein
LEKSKKTEKRWQETDNIFYLMFLNLKFVSTYYNNLGVLALNYDFHNFCRIVGRKKRLQTFCPLTQTQQKWIRFIRVSNFSQRPTTLQINRANIPKTIKREQVGYKEL